MENKGFIERLELLMSQRNGKNGRKTSSYRVGKDVEGITSAAIDKYIKGKSMPGPDKVKLLADYFGVSAGWLLFGDEGGTTFSSKEIAVSTSEMWDVLKASVYNQNAQNDHISKLIEMLREKTKNDKKETSTCVAV